jgi:endonuclease/exonuclease/phosphatase family metal-dependent hydrolase
MKPTSVFLLCLFLFACTAAPESPLATVAETAEPSKTDQARVSVMAFNVENLFDTADAAGKNDETYLPASIKNTAQHKATCDKITVERWREECLTLDWNDDVLQFKLEQLAATILAYNQGHGPDIIALQEIENLAVLERLRHEHLKPAGYREPVFIEGNDHRGIDVAFLTRLPVVGQAELHPIDMSAFPERADDTRGILEAQFELPDGTILTGYSVHFPAPFHPTGMRRIAYQHLNQLRADQANDSPAFAAGDFNTPKREQEGTDIMDTLVRPFWTVAHEVGCQTCKGTNYWRRGKSWSFLDMVLFAPSSAASWRLDVEAVEVVTAYRDQLHDDGTPKRFNAQEREGVSDHLPIVVVLERHTDS